METPRFQEIYTFPGIEFIENVHVLPNGVLLLSTMKSPHLLYTLDPNAPKPVAKPAASFKDTTATGLTGIVALGGDRYAVGGGVHQPFCFERGSVHVYIVCLETKSVVDRILVPDTATLNGMAGLPAHPHVVLGADSIDGRIFSIDTRTRDVKVLLENDALAPMPEAGLKIGINGLRIRDGHLYFTNSTRGSLARYPIDEHGNKVGEIEILVQRPPGSTMFDDFAFDREGSAYIAAHPSSVIKVVKKGGEKEEEFSTEEVSGSGCEPKHPTSAALALDGKAIYLVTGGAWNEEPPTGGQVIRINV
ncbi:NHL repeat-containing protein [Xylariaceae sp. FL0594]|nr:NHL repeat-containing protein [Xylariaceae sp. FL0594]